jgi:hypothetical protein
MQPGISLTATALLIGIFILTPGCNRSPSRSSTAKRGDAAEQPTPIPVPPDLKTAVTTLVHAVETLDIPQVLEAYADDFASGTGRSKAALREVLARMQENHVVVKVEKTDFEEASDSEAKLRTQVRLRYTDTFRDLGEGEVLVTDILRHSLRKDDTQWHIYKDERISTYREGRFGERSPNVQLEVPTQLPTTVDYTVTISVQRETDKTYQVMVGNYPEDPEFLPPPDIVTALPDTGPLTVNLIRNPQGRSEMVRITVITEDSEGNWVGATTVSKFVPAPLGEGDPEDQHDA